MIAQIVPVKRGLKTLPFFDYSVPNEIAPKITVGQLVEIPLRNSTVYGLVIALNVRSSAPLKNLRPVEKIVFERPLLSANMVAFLKEISEMYFISLGSLIKSCLPPLKKTKLAKQIIENIKTTQNSLFKKPVFTFYKNQIDKISTLNKLFDRTGQTLVLLPEVNDVRQAFENLSVQQRKTAAIITSELSEKEFYELWFDIWSGKIKIIFATRIGFFLSFNDLKKIIVLDSFHFSHKSWDQAPRYNSKDAALSLGKHLGAEVEFLTHTPSVEDQYFLINKIYSAAPDFKIPVLQNPEIVNLDRETRAGNFTGISLPLEDAIRETLHGNIFIHCNRRGTASFVSCKDCGMVEKCSNCKLTLSWHENEHRLVCHHCNLARDFDPLCNKCGGVNISYFGAGVDGVAKELKKLFPELKDKIRTFDKENIDQQKVKDLKDSIIVGTQAVWQHLDWKNLQVLAFIDADTPLYTPEYLSAENMWFTIRDALVRLNPDSRVILQTRNPEHPVYLALSDPNIFYYQELESRKVFDYPPFKYLLKLFIIDQNEQLVVREADKLYRSLTQLTKTFADIKITQPLNMFPYSLKGKFRKTIIIKLPYRNYKELLKKVIKLAPNEWKADPNPISLLSI